MTDLSKPSPTEFIAEERKLTLDPSDPMKIAQTIISKEFTTDEMRMLHHHAGMFWLWENNCYSVIDDKGISSVVYRVLDNALQIKGDGIAPFKPTSHKVNNVMAALCAELYLNNKTNAPAWLDGREQPNPKNILALKNGLLDLTDRTLIKPTPIFWTNNALEYEYSSEATVCEEWLKFLLSVWGEDTESIESLQEIIGYLLTGDTSQQKMFMLIGPPRSGKGTIGRILAELLGHNNICSPTLNSLTGNFGMSPMIGKLVAIVADARLGPRADQHQIAEKLLSISGEDSQTIDIKFKTQWQGRLQTRIFIMSNELPRISDASGAVSSRFIILKMTRSFLGLEDRGLFKRLKGELPAILNWALDGRDRLNQRGFFKVPTSSEDTVQQLGDLSSPIGAFIRDYCEVGGDCEVKVSTLFKAWQNWCREQGRDHTGISSTFSKELSAAVAGISTIQKREGGKSRFRYFKGLKLI